MTENIVHYQAGNLRVISSKTDSSRILWIQGRCSAVSLLSSSHCCCIWLVSWLPGFTSLAVETHHPQRFCCLICLEAKSGDRTVPWHQKVGQELVIVRVLHHVKWLCLKIRERVFDLQFWYPCRLQISQEQREIQFTPQTLCGCEHLRLSSASMGSSACGVYSETEQISWGRIHAGQCMVYLHDIAMPLHLVHLFHCRFKSYEGNREPNTFCGFLCRFWMMFWLNLWSFELTSKWPAPVIVQEVGGRGVWPKVLSQANRTSRSLGFAHLETGHFEGFLPQHLFIYFKNYSALLLYTWNFILLQTGSFLKGHSMALRGRLRWMQACGSKSFASRWLDSSLVHTQEV